jgi:hypothetical protein
VLRQALRCEPKRCIEIAHHRDPRVNSRATDANNKETNMNRFFADAEIGRKNIVAGIVLFLVLGVVVGIPLTVDFLGGSLLTTAQYQSWKVIHGYSVFLAFINFFLGMGIDRFKMPVGRKEIVSWSFLAAGVVGGMGRMILVLLSSLDQLGRYASLIETVLFVLGTILIARVQMQGKQAIQ